MSDDTKLVFVVRKDLHMRAGKIAVQVAHATQEVIRDLCTKKDVEGTYSDRIWESWRRNNFKKICLYCKDEAELLKLSLEAEEVNLTVKLVEDLGFTEFNGVPTLTCMAIGPAPTSQIDPITKDLKLA